jgi:hypothetical protein
MGCKVGNVKKVPGFAWGTSTTGFMVLVALYMIESALL